MWEFMHFAELFKEAHAEFVLAVVLGWIAFSMLLAVFARLRRNRSGFGWFLLAALLISPLVAFLLLMILPARALEGGHRHFRPPPNPLPPLASLRAPPDS